MHIQKLPDYLINRLKAGEVVERPASVLKELIENAIDAAANHIDIYINDGGKKSIVVQDNGTGIEQDDLSLVLERYATSKIKEEADLHSIRSYGFRGEALSAIAEVAKLTIQTKTRNMPIGLQLAKRGEYLATKKIATSFDHGTSIMVEELFYNTPARKKFLKSTQTEYFYIYQLFINFALVNRHTGFALTKNDKQIFSLTPASDVIERITNIYKKDREKQFLTVDFTDGKHRLYGIIGDSGLHFGSRENIKIFVNKRPVNDRIIKRAILDAYRRQLPPNTYPFAIIFLDIDPEHIDVNVHPRKTEVKFLDPGSIFQLVKSQVKQSLGGTKTTHGQHTYREDKTTQTTTISLNNHQNHSSGETKRSHNTTDTSLWSVANIQTTIQNKQTQTAYVGDIQIIGQLRDSYIILQDNEALYYIDQHALAERILFEQMNTKAQTEGHKPEPLLQPISIARGKEIPLEDKLDQMSRLGFDINQFGENKLVVYAVPKILTEYVIDFEVLLQRLLPLETINFVTILEEIFATKACKAAIKAGQRLSMLEMKQLIQDGYEYIEGTFVCQHGRPFFIKIDKNDLEKLFDR